MLVQSRLKEGVTLGSLKNLRLIERKDNLYENLLNTEKRGFTFKIGLNEYSVLPLITYYLTHSYKTKKSKQAKQNNKGIIEFTLAHLNEVVLPDDMFKNKNLTNRDVVFREVSERLSDFEKDIVYGGNHIKTLEACMRFINCIDKLGLNGEAVTLKGKPVDFLTKMKYIPDVYKAIIGLNYAMGNELGYKRYCECILHMLYDIEDNLLKGGSDIDGKVLEFMYICLRKYFEQYVDESPNCDESDIGLLNVNLSIDDYMEIELFKTMLTDISTIQLPLLGASKDDCGVIFAGIQDACVDIVRIQCAVLTSKLCNAYVDDLKDKQLEIDTMYKDFKNKDRVLNKELKAIKDELKQKEKNIVYKDKQIAKLKDIIETKEKESGVSELKDMLDDKLAYIKELEMKLEQKDKRIASLEGKTAMLSDKVKSENSVKEGLVSIKPSVSECNTVTLEEKIEVIKDKNYLLIGGNSTLEEGLKKILPNISFKKHMLNFEVSNKVDYVLMYTKNIGHRSTYKVETYANNVSDIISLYNSNISKIIDTIYSKVTMLENHAI